MNADTPKTTEERTAEATSPASNASVADRLPIPDEQGIEAALTSVGWAAGIVEALSEGAIHHMNDLGIDLQVVSKQIVRCIAVVDHPYCWETLALLLVTFEEAGINLEIDPYTVVRPYVPDSKADTPPEQEVGVVGMEVV
jgi:hypothetical protein